LSLVDQIHMKAGRREGLILVEASTSACVDARHSQPIMAEPTLKSSRLPAFM
jgi:hypothetical protein